MKQSLPVGITMGDAAGIGPEIVVQAFAKGLDAPAIVYGDAGALRRAVQLLGARLEVEEIPGAAQTGQIGRASDGGDAAHAGSPGLAAPRAGVIQVVACHPPLPADLPPGQVDARAGQAAYAYVCAAIDDALAGRIRAIVTAPLNKASMHAGGVDYPGHTEILAERSGTQDFAMMLANRELRVLLVTIHVALADVFARITLESELRAIRLAHTACRQMGIARPRVAVAGLNPHAGEHGKFGREEIDVIGPAIQAARQEGIDASGPWPGDTIFMRARRGDFDIVVAQYHDQGLIPVKYLGVEEGVNVTVGLPFVRTSVDHGTAFDIAWQGVADPTSLIVAFDLALAMTGH
ncbi:4-hydroxythreonine-4-phosphate dehydrogenase PdxA [Bordetella genomosp. 9]|uniref:4-hydroxythreonine-4-phosphate dehydrogenase PdxA n=1 Tax=Bordetella genomosp. 9 TaxID=1416803 RepID=A0A261R433_9BORD|nr:4-hydroxythreonine-4-phosphate dehydrogenase PdxA [Bordetella genomosp. 9]OZI19507.1 4-hydroxythreonine-4-phosphate dehydrogenase PdxA [Bordetella genomosp. 9]